MMCKQSHEQGGMKTSIIQGIAQVNGACLSYEVAEGHPVVFVQGGHPLGLHVWDDQFLPFSSFLSGYSV